VGAGATHCRFLNAGTVSGVSLSNEFISIKSWAATGEDEPGMMEGTAEVPHQIVDTHLPEAASVFDAATALDTARDMVDPQPTLVQFLVRHVLLPRELLPQIEINSTDPRSSPGSAAREVSSSKRRGT
jgi:hypothetical protein